MSVLDAVTLVPTAALFLVILSEYALMLYPRKKHDPTYSPPISVVVPAYNEEENIEDCVKAMLSTEYDSEKELIFVDDGSTDSTLKKLKELRKKHGITVYSIEHGGKAAALNHGIKNAKHDVVMVADADSVPGKHSLKHLVRPLKHEDVAGVAGVVRVKNKDSVLSWFQSIEYAYFSYFNSITAKINGIIFTPGVISAYKKPVLKKLNAFPVGSFIEDFEIALNLHAGGYKIEIADKAVAYTKVPTTLQGLFKQRLRWGQGILSSTDKMHYLVFNTKHPVIGFYSLPVLLYWFAHALLSVPLILYSLFSGYFTWFVANGQAFSLKAGEYFFNWLTIFGYPSLLEKVLITGEIPLTLLLGLSLIITPLSYGYYLYSIYKYDRVVGWRELIALSVFLPYVLFIAFIQITAFFRHLFNKSIKWKD